MSSNLCSVYFDDFPPESPSQPHLCWSSEVFYQFYKAEECKKKRLSEIYPEGDWCCVEKHVLGLQNSLVLMAQTPEPSSPHPGINPFLTRAGSLLQPGNYIWMKSSPPQKNKLIYSIKRVNILVFLSGETRD